MMKFRTITANNSEHLDTQINDMTKDGTWSLWSPPQAVYKEHGKLVWYCTLSQTIKT